MNHADLIAEAERRREAGSASLNTDRRTLMQKSNVTQPEVPNQDAITEADNLAGASFDSPTLGGFSHPRPLTNGAAPDPYDPAALRLSQDFTAGSGVKKALLTVPVRKPGKTAFYRVHPSTDYALPTILLEVEGDRDSTYLIAPELRSALAAEPACAPWQLYTAIDRQDVLFLWKVRLPGADGKSNPWWDSAHEAAARAQRTWVKIAANQALGAYDVWEAASELSEPNWPNKSSRELLAIAFKGKLIDSLDHPVLRKLRGEI
jgi:hypothetical protein